MNGKPVGASGRRSARHIFWSAVGVVAICSVVVVPAAASPGVGGRVLAATAANKPAFTKTETITRDHLVNGADDVVDTRTVTLSVDQTTNLRERQEINVSWSGAHPTGGIIGDQNSALAGEQEYPMVLMECRGIDSPTAPAADQISPSTCWTHTPEERFQSDTFSYPSFRMDRYASVADRAAQVGLPSPLPTACLTAGSGIQHWIPLVAADGTVYPEGFNGCAGLPPEAVNFEQSLQPDSTTYATTNLAGNGSAKFTVATAESNASLGCSNTVPCSLVAIPIMGISCDAAGVGMPAADRPSPQSLINLTYQRCSGTGNYKPGQLSFGFPLLEDLAVSGDLWWSASNWRNRVSVPLTFAPAPNACDQTNKSAPIYLYGSELMTQATQQWSPAFCLNPKLFKIQHVQTSEPEAKNLLQAGGVEAAIQGAPPQTPFSKPVVEAPIALTGFAVVFTIDGANNQPLLQLKLTPRLLAKLLTESYPAEPVVRDYDPPLSHNPLDIGLDPEFQALNPDVPIPSVNNIPAATIYTISSDSDVIWSLTSYINSDPAARAWLNGAPDPWGMTVNPAYKGIQLPVTNWPLLDTFHSGPAYGSDSPCLSSDPTPYLPLVAVPVSTMAAVTINMQFGIANSQLVCFDAGAQDQKLTALGRETPGQRFLLGITPLADASRYELSAASLQTQVNVAAPSKFTNSTGRTFVAPSSASLQAAAALLQPTAAAGTWTLPYGDFQTDTKAATAYPGTMLISADVPTGGLPSQDATRYGTFLDWAVTTGQTPGDLQGELPGGYLPLTVANGLGSEVQYTEVAAKAVAAQGGLVPPLVPAPSTSSTTTVAHSTTTTRPPITTNTTVPLSPTGSGSLSNPNTASSPSATTAASQGLAAALARTATKGSVSYVEPAGALGRTLAVGSGLGGLALPLALLLAILGGASAALISWLRRPRSRT